jgi:hypothetical protein
MKKEIMSFSVLIFAPFLHSFALADEINSAIDLGQPILCSHDGETIEVQMIADRKIELIYENGATATLNFAKQVQPNGCVYFQYKGKTTGLDYKTTTAYLSPDHTTLLLPHSDESTGTYIQYGCQEFVATP